MDYNRKLEYFYYLSYKKIKENEDIEEKNTNSRGQRNIPTQLPEMIDTFISGKITVEELEILKAKKKKERRERRRENGRR